MPQLHLAKFCCDATPPIGHPLCGGWIDPARGIDDPLSLRGVVLLGDGSPIVLAALDWCGLRNEANIHWRRALADAAHTTPENVALQCVHQHNAPFADLEAEAMLESLAGAPHSLDLKYYDQIVERSAQALRDSLKNTHLFNQIGVGKAKVERVASNRRILGQDGKIKSTRFSAAKDPAVRSEPEGSIDPYLRTLSFWKNEEPIAAFHYYATHPMSYYGDGRVSADFCGLARQKRQDDDVKVSQVYFTGCAGNITAGKYNDGAHTNRPVLRDRIYHAMILAWKDTVRHAVMGWRWQTADVRLPPRRDPGFLEEASTALLRDPTATKAKRINAAFQLSWLKRRETPITVSCLQLGPAVLLHLPGEPFIEYQLTAQVMRNDSFVCVAGYGDGGPGYLPTRDAYWQGGYEPTVAPSAPESESILLGAMEKVLRR